MLKMRNLRRELVAQFFVMLNILPTPTFNPNNPPVDVEIFQNLSKIKKNLLAS